MSAMATIPRVALITMILTVGTAASCTAPNVSTPSTEDAEDAAGRELRFSDVAPAAGVALPAGPTWGSLLVDYDRNGWPDLLIGRHKRHARLFDNVKGSFSLNNEPALSTAAPGRHIYDRHGCAWGEANGDGRADLYCTSGAQDGQGEGPNQLLLQTEHGFSEVAREQGVQDLLGRGRSANWMDYDRDGDLDIFVSNEIRSGHPNIMFRNDHDGFNEVDVGLSHETPTRSSSWSDWDNDSDPDILVLGHGFVASRAYENRQGVFVEVPFPAVTAKEWLAGSWGDFDLDGWTDVALVNESRLLILRNRKGKFKRVKSVELAAGRTVAWLDLENDGDLDAFVLQGQKGDPPKPGALNHPDFLLINTNGRFHVTRDASVRGPTDGNGDSVAAGDFDRDGGVDLHVTDGYLDVFGEARLLRNVHPRANWIRVVLEGARNNPFGFGTKVIVNANGDSYSQAITDAVAFRSQSETGIVHFGLGDETQVTIQVIWPNGLRSCVGSGSNRVLHVSPTSSPCS